MALRIIYIKEVNLNDLLAAQLKMVRFEEEPVIFFVELREVDEKLIPMISDLPALRLRKAERRIVKWINDKLDHIDKFEVSVFNGRPNKSNPRYSLSIEDDQKLDVILNSGHEPRFANYLNHYAGSDQIKYLSLGDFNGQDINT
jgi:hypothetical protein